jgi:acetyl esterase
MTDDPFAPGAITPATRAFVDELEARLAQLPAAHEVPIELSRKARDEGLGPFPFHPPEAAAEDRAIPGAPGGPGRVRIQRPEGRPTGVFLHIHGGGWTLGRPWHQDHRMKDLIARTGCATVSVEYRLAPENPWPACVEDCAAAARWLVDNATAEFGTDRLAIGGESAGAHLSATTLLAMRDEGRLDAFHGALMVYGAYDMTKTPSVANWGDRKLILSTPTIEWFSANLGVPEDRLRDPLVSPLYADLTGMPEALFQCGTFDPLMDDTAFMAARWSMAGARQQTIWYPGGVHAFDYFDTELGRTAIADGAAFLRRVFTA